MVRGLTIVITTIFIAGMCLLTGVRGQVPPAKETEGPAAEEVMEGPVKFADGLISVKAKDMRSEDLLKEVGEKCAIKIVLYGEVFTDTPLSAQFHQVPVRQGIQRILRLAKVKNYLMHFEESKKEDKVVQLDLIGKKGGQRELTGGAKPTLKKHTAEQVITNLGDTTAAAGQREQAKEKELPKVVTPQLNKEDAERMQQNFLNMMDQMLEKKFEKGEEPDPAALLQLFKDMVPPEMQDKIPPEVLEQMEKLKQN